MSCQLESSSPKYCTRADAKSEKDPARYRLITAGTDLNLTGEGAADAGEASVGGFFEGMLPDADDLPALAAEFFSYADMW